MAKNEGMMMSVPTKNIRANKDFNVRAAFEKPGEHKKETDKNTGKVTCCYTHAVTELANDIKRNGLMTPLVVKQMPGNKFDLIAGFRRLDAVKLLGWDTVAVQVRDMTEEQAYLLNTIENTSREDLTSFEVANRCKLFKTKFGWSGERIAEKLNKSKGYVNSLLASLENLHPEIIEAWKNRDTRAKTDYLNKLKVMNHTEQMALWKATPEKGKGKDKGEKKEGTKARSGEVLDHAIAKAATTEPSMFGGLKVKDAVIAALKFARGQEDLICGVGGLLPEPKTLPREAREAVEAAALAEAEGELADVEGLQTELDG